MTHYQPLRLSESLNLFTGGKRRCLFLWLRMNLNSSAAKRMTRELGNTTTNIMVICLRYYLKLLNIEINTEYNAGIFNFKR